MKGSSSQLEYYNRVSWAIANKKTSLVMCLIKFTPLTLLRSEVTGLCGTRQNLKRQKCLLSFHSSLNKTHGTALTQMPVTSFHFFLIFTSTKLEESSKQRNATATSFLSSIYPSFFSFYTTKLKGNWVQWQT